MMINCERLKVSLLRSETSQGYLLFNNSLEILARPISQGEKKKKRQPDIKARSTSKTLLLDAMILYAENPKYTHTHPN